MNVTFRLIFIVFISIISFSCAERNKTVFEGEWEDVSSQTLLGYEIYRFTFADNTFWLKYSIYSDVDVTTCKSLIFSRNDYFGGFYFFDNDSLYLKGTFIKSTFVDSNQIEQNLPDCKNKYGKIYHYSYKYRFNKDTLILRVRENYSYGDNNFSETDSIGAEILTRLSIFLKRK